MGAFLKDGPDIEPFTMLESDHESYFWLVMPRVPKGHEGSFRALKDAGGSFQSISKAAQVLIHGVDVGRATAFRHVNTFLRIGLLSKHDGRLVLNDTAQPTKS